MKFMHLSDLHLGKRLNDFSLLEDQAYILHQILTIADSERPDAVLIAGDLYDKPVPPAEAVSLLDDFLVQLSKRRIPALIISGNHDSPERIAFGAQLMGHSGVFLSPVYNGRVEPITLEDTFGPVDVFLLPFIKPAHVRRFYPDEEIASYTDALSCAIGHMHLQPGRRSVLVTHQLVAGADRCDSEEISFGGSDAVDVSVFRPFDYVALGHLHSPQNVAGQRVRYCGTPLKYSFSEAGHMKSITIAELGHKGDLRISSIPLAPLRDMTEIRGSYDQFTDRSFYASLDRSVYLHVTLTDEEDIPDAAARLRVIYPHLMKLDYDNHRTRSTGDFAESIDLSRHSPLAMFSDFYQKQNGQPMLQEQTAYMERLIASIKEGEV